MGDGPIAHSPAHTDGNDQEGGEHSSQAYPCSHRGSCVDCSDFESQSSDDENDQGCVGCAAPPCRHNGTCVICSEVESTDSESGDGDELDMGLDVDQEGEDLEQNEIEHNEEGSDGDEDVEVQGEGDSESGDEFEVRLDVDHEGEDHEQNAEEGVEILDEGDVFMPPEDVSSNEGDMEPPELTDSEDDDEGEALEDFLHFISGEDEVGLASLRNYLPVPESNLIGDARRMYFRSLEESAPTFSHEILGWLKPTGIYAAGPREGESLAARRHSESLLVQECDLHSCPVCQVWSCTDYRHSQVSVCLANMREMQDDASSKSLGELSGFMLHLPHECGQFPFNYLDKRGNSIGAMFHGIFCLSRTRSQVNSVPRDRLEIEVVPQMKVLNKLKGTRGKLKVDIVSGSWYHCGFLAYRSHTRQLVSDKQLQRVVPDLSKDVLISAGRRFTA